MDIKIKENQAEIDKLIKKITERLKTIDKLNNVGYVSKKEYLKRYFKTARGRIALRKSLKKWKNTVKGKQFYQRQWTKRKKKIQDERRDNYQPTPTNVLNEIGFHNYKRREWSNNDIMLLINYRCSGKRKKFISWKKIGIELNRPQKEVRAKWREILDKKETYQELGLNWNGLYEP